MKKGFLIIGIVLAALLAIALVISFVFWFAFGGGSFFLPNPPKPKITYGEFNFELVYEVNEETRTLSDTLICEFDGFNVDEARGKTRRWKEHYKNIQNNELYAYRIEDPGYYKDGGNNPKYNQIVLQNIDHYKIVFSIASAEYFLGEPDYKVTPGMPYIQVYDKSIGYYKDPNETKKFLNEHNFKVINWYCDPPIQNSFE